MEPEQYFLLDVEQTVTDVVKIGYPKFQHDPDVLIAYEDEIKKALQKALPWCKISIRSDIERRESDFE